MSVENARWERGWRPLPSAGSAGSARCSSLALSPAIGIKVSSGVFDGTVYLLILTTSKTTQGAGAAAATGHWRLLFCFLLLTQTERERERVGTGSRNTGWKHEWMAARRLKCTRLIIVVFLLLDMYKCPHSSNHLELKESPGLIIRSYYYFGL